MSEVTIIDSGGANLASLEIAFRRLGATTQITDSPQEVTRARRVVLPGVGAATPCMKRLYRSGLAALLPTLAQPVLGVCLGMQLFYQYSEEGPTSCLGLLPQTVRGLAPAPGRPIPHMGWNTLHHLQSDPLLEGVREGEYVYFVHSYGAPVSTFTIATAQYGLPLSAVVRRNNFWGTQFHPERSGSTGVQILKNFLRL
ncbi:MAG: imidazole glycerol phosphate synthase subunit HisH [Proteobacteria bacterium]|nr:imidazole glycerol phosphate synthase subunit HisH [Pseudomonadota bacterium]